VIPTQVQGRWSHQTRWRTATPHQGQGAWRPQLDPGTGKAFTRVLDQTPDEVAAHLAEIRLGYEDASPVSIEDRVALLNAFADAVEEHAAALGELDALCTGKLLSEAVRTAERAPKILRWYASLIESNPFVEELEPIAPGTRQRVDRLPVGLVTAILPWNYPVSQTCVRVSALLASGNATVFKGSELAQPPLLALEELARAAGLPPWAFSVVTGGPDVGQALIDHSDVDGVLFTGGIATGLDVAETAIATLKRLVLELGGKTPNVVFADADVGRAVPAAADAAFRNQGQICSAGSLLLIERPIYEEFVARLVEHSRALRLGHQLDATSEMGPLISETQRRRVDRLVRESRAAGAEVLCGGQPPADEALRSGYFFEPTVLVELPSDSPVATEETFGPVVAAAPFDDEDEIVTRTNTSPYGLAAAIWTSDATRAERLRSKLRTGVVWINCHGPLAYNAPWGGFRMSGVGRILGRDALFAFTETRQTYELVSKP
jgi:acyl-CoA reductase-like NAD-dependent aldehyde dehydrogenase